MITLPFAFLACLTCGTCFGMVAIDILLLHSPQGTMYAWSTLGISSWGGGSNRQGAGLATIIGTV